MDALEAMSSRRSVRSFKPDPVSEDVLRRIVDAGRLAPTGHNDQPWEFIVVRDAEQRRRIAAITDFGKFIAEAPACIVVLCKPTQYYLEDGAAATTNMLNAATALGVASCWVAGDKKTYATRLASMCGAPPDYRLVALIALGQAAEVPAPQKRGLDDVLHWETYRRSR
jgi:nitroreductase